jgi:hypothetical protein
MTQSASPPRFNQTLVSIIDQAIPGTGGSDFSQTDSGQLFLREVMQFDDSRMQSFRQEAEAFYRDTYGFDFTGISVDSDNIKRLPGAMLAPFCVNPEADYTVILHSNIGELSPANRVRDGGFFVSITGPGVVYHGTYGGPAGKPASPGEIMPFGFYNIVSLQERTGAPDTKRAIIINYHALSPVQRTADGDMVLHCGLQHSIWGAGAMRGVQVIARADATHIRITKRNVLTFPGMLAP